MLALGNKIIAGSFKAGASWEVGDVGISAFGIDEALNKRRYLNGQVISQAQFVEFTAMLKSRVSVYPNLATTEVNWQAEVTNSKLGQCGKFVIDDDAGTIRLPKVVNINGLQDLTGLGGIKAESLPNIKGDFWAGMTQGVFFNDGTGAFAGKSGAGGTQVPAVGGAYSANNRWDMDASRSSSTYQDNAPVQQEAVQYPYFIQVAEGVETSVDVSREIELNNPFSLLDYKYSEYELSNASWLLSNGQWNSGAVYTAVYNLLLAIYNGTVTKAGVSVKLSTEAYADTDFVVNTSDTTFRLPLKVALASGNKIAGNGYSLGFTDGTVDGIVGLGLGYTSATGQIFAPFKINPVGTQNQYDASMTTSSCIGVTTDETKSGIETSANGLYLYFYVGEVVQDANIIAAGQALTDIADLKNASNFSQTGLSTLSGLGMPSDRYEDLTLGASGATYTAPANGWFLVDKLGNAGQYMFAANAKKYTGAQPWDYFGRVYTQTSIGSYTNSSFTLWIPCQKGDRVCINYDASGAVRLFRFVYAEGEN